MLQLRRGGERCWFAQQSAPEMMYRRENRLPPPTPPPHGTVAGELLLKRVFCFGHHEGRRNSWSDVLPRCHKTRDVTYFNTTFWHWYRAETVRRDIAWKYFPTVQNVRGMASRCVVVAQTVSSLTDTVWELSCPPPPPQPPPAHLSYSFIETSYFYPVFSCFFFYLRCHLSSEFLVSHSSLTVTPAVIYQTWFQVKHLRCVQ